MKKETIKKTKKLPKMYYGNIGFKNIGEVNAYVKGYDNGSREQSKIFEMTYQKETDKELDAFENGLQVQSWSKYGEYKVDWVDVSSKVLLVVVVLGIVLAIIFSNPQL